MGIPIFVSPARPNRSGQIKTLSIVGRSVSYQVHNTGNVHFVIERHAEQSSVGDRMYDRETLGSLKLLDWNSVSDCDFARALINAVDLY